MSKTANEIKFEDFIFTSVVGMEYACTKAEIRRLMRTSIKKGAKVMVRREPKNKHDKNACAVHLGSKRIGYLPRHDAFDLAPRFDQGDKFVFFINDSLYCSGLCERWPSLFVLGVRQR